MKQSDIKTQFTPGPWQWDKRWGQMAGPAEVIFQCKSGQLNLPPDEDASLIVAAPDMYAMLCELVDQAQTDRPTLQTWVRAKAVLKKARGEDR